MVVDVFDFIFGILKCSNDDALANFPRNFVDMNIAAVVG